MRSKSSVLETAILGLLNDAHLHGYELRKRLNLVLGSFRALSYGSLYPCLKSMESRGLIIGRDSTEAPPHALTGKRARIVYRLTPEGKEHLQSVLSSSGPSAWEDESFDVRFAFFSQTDRFRHVSYVLAVWWFGQLGNNMECSCVLQRGTFAPTGKNIEFSLWVLIRIYFKTGQVVYI